MITAPNPKPFPSKRRPYPHMRVIDQNESIWRSIWHKEIDGLMQHLTLHSLGEETYSWTHSTTLFIAMITLFLVACESLGMKSDLIGIGDDKEHVLKIMGPPNDRQLKGSNEAWQYCQTTGAGFGYHDNRIIWLYNGKVTGITSHTSSRGGSSCVMGIPSVRWEEAP